MKTIEQAALEHAAPIIILQQFNPAQDFIAGVKFAQQWINVEDELPKETEVVLIKTEYETYSTAYLLDSKWVVGNEYLLGTVHFWRHIELK